VSKEITPRTRKRKLLLLMTLMIAPIALSYLLFFWGAPSGRVNYGELIEVKVLPDIALRKTDGVTFNISQLRGKWIMLVVDSGMCDESCRKKLYFMRQIRLMQKTEMERIERVWLIDDDKIPKSGILKDFKGTVLINAKGSEMLKAIPAKISQHDHIYMIDPLGNLMMRFPKDVDPSRMAKDLKRLLKISQIG
jgi:cytochrome oxidase Cu insertion factor (SCO1/SenC/PrrC family)